MIHTRLSALLGVGDERIPPRQFRAPIEDQLVRCPLREAPPRTHWLRVAPVAEREITRSAHRFEVIIEKTILSQS